ncbi:LOW QUALITY PROTEIN: uncharacterized protein ACB058_020600 [Synchiropus picturatus]
MPTSPPPPPGDRPSAFQTRSSPFNPEAVNRRGTPPTDTTPGQFSRETAPARLHRESQLDGNPDTAAAASVSEHPYLRLYQYLHQKTTPPAQQLPSPPPVAQPPALGASQEKSSMARPVTHVVAPGPAVQHLDVRDHQSPFGASDSVPSSPNPLPPGSRRGTAPSPPSLSPYHKHKTFLPTPNSTPPLPSKPPPSPGNRRRPPTSGGNPLPAAPCGAPVSLLAVGSDSGQTCNTKSRSAIGGKRARLEATPPLEAWRHLLPPHRRCPAIRRLPGRRPPPCRETTAPTVHVREAPPPPPVRSLGSPSLPSDHPVRVKPPAPPPPPPSQSGNASPTCSASSLNTDFESRFSFHRVEDFPPPEIFKLLSNVYPSKAQKVMRGAPPLPPVGR